MAQVRIKDGGQGRISSGKGIPTASAWDVSMTSRVHIFKTFWPFLGLWFSFGATSTITFDDPAIGLGRARQPGKVR